MIQIVIGSILFGILIMLRPIYSNSYYKVSIDFTYTRWFLGPALIIFGSILFWVVFRKKSENYKTEMYICPKCEVANNLNSTEKLICNNCNIPLEPLNGFYERHPEIK